MDHDQEVVREPFENNDDDDEVESLSSSHQPKFDDQLQDLDTKTIDNNVDLLFVQESSDVDDDSSTSSASIEDVNFAKSFGIHLKSSKSQSAYERLMGSDHFESQQEQGANKSTPVIKTSITSDCIYHKGTFYQKGDIVALCDQDDGQVYFAQLTGFLQDQYCEKSASLNWLVPTRPTSRDFFEPSAYRIGLEDVQLRKLDCMTFVRHCPHDYYLRKFFQLANSKTDDQLVGEGCQDEDYAAKSTRQHTIETSYKKNAKDQAYIWTTMEPCRVPTIETNPKCR